MATILPSIKHESLRANLIPCEQDGHCQFRGIKYASIPGRFEHSVRLDDWNWKTLDCTQFGPKCPQPYRDVRHFFSVPAEQESPPPIEEDEFQCLNLVVSVPDDVIQNRSPKVPVLIYIHGGGHAYTMVNIEQGFTDPTEILKTSSRLGRPFIMVHFAYRVNVFGYGVFEGRTNFGFHDQKRVIEWVRKHIAGFGGDPDQITLYGESAGAIAVHAHIHGPSPIPGIKRAILQSGSLYLTPPAPQAVGSLVMKKLEALSETDDLKNLPVGALLQGLGHLGFQNWWLHDEGEIFSPGTQQIEWPITGPPELEAILIGDCQWESRGFEPRIVSIGLQGLQELFARYSSVGSQIIELYQIDFSSMEAARPRVSAFINDLKFAFGSDEIFRMERELGKRKCFRYVVDQVNPWNHSAGAHHAIDLAFLFGGPFNYSHDESAKIVGTSMRESWITFINGGDPWEQDTVYGFGPKGNCRAIKPEVLSQRRRTHCINSLREIGWSRCQPLITRLMGARGVVVEAYLDDGTAWLTNDTKRGR